MHYRPIMHAQLGTIGGIYTLCITPRHDPDSAHNVRLCLCFVLRVCQIWQCSMCEHVPLHACTVPQSHSEIVISLVVTQTCRVPRTDCVPLISALVHLCSHMFYCSCLCFPLVKRHYLLICTVQNVSVSHMQCLVKW